MPALLLLACVGSSPGRPDKADSGPEAEAHDSGAPTGGDSSPETGDDDSSAHTGDTPTHDPSEEECAFALAVEPLACELFAPGPVEPGTFTRLQTTIWDSFILWPMLAAGDDACPGPRFGDHLDDQAWSGPCVTTDGVTFAGSATYTFDDDSNWGTFTLAAFTADSDEFHMAMDGTWKVYWTSEGSFSEVDLLSELVGSPDDDYTDGSRYVRGWVNYNNANDTSNLYVVDGGEDYCFRAEASYLGCSEEPRGWMQVVGQQGSVIGFDGRSPCDGCGCYVEDSAAPVLGCP